MILHVFIWGRPINCWFKTVPKEEGNTEEGKVSLVQSGKRICFADPVEENVLKTSQIYKHDVLWYTKDQQKQNNGFPYPPDN